MIYRGYEISQGYDLSYHAVDPEADYDHNQDGFYQCSGMPSFDCKTVEAVKIEIDDYFEELGDE